MKKSKLIVLFSSLSATEMDQFGEFLRSPYFNKDQDLVRFHQLLHTYYPDFAEPEPDKVKLYQKLFPKQSFDKKHLSYLMSGLTRLLEKFLGLQALEKQEIFFACQTLRAMVERNLGKHYNYLEKHITQRLEQQTERNGHHIYLDFLLADIAVEHFAAREVRKYDKNLQNVSDALDRFYFIRKLKYSCEMLNRQAILTDKFAIPFMDEVQQYLSTRQHTEPLIEIYLQIYFSLLHATEERYLLQLLDLIKLHAEQIEKRERRDVYLFALNGCVRKVREGKEQYLQIMLDLYQEGISNRALYDKQFLSHWTYNNIVKLALRLQRFTWVETFINEYNSSLQKQFRANALHYNLAELFFHKQDYDTALTHLRQVQSTDINYHLGSRILLIKTYYESNATDALLSLLASFSVYLSRNKQIGTSLKKSCQNFCNVLHRSMSTKTELKKQRLQERIKTLQPLADRPWLMKVFAEQVGGAMR